MLTTSQTNITPRTAPLVSPTEGSRTHSLGTTVTMSIPSREPRTRLYSLDCPNSRTTPTPDVQPRQDLTSLETMLGTSEKNLSVSPQSKKSPLFSELDNVLGMRSHRSKTLGSRPSRSPGLLDRPTIHSPSSGAPSNQNIVQTKPGRVESTVVPDYRNVLKKRSHTLTSVPTHSSHPGSKPDLQSSRNLELPKKKPLPKPHKSDPKHIEEKAGMKIHLKHVGANKKDWSVSSEGASIVKHDPSSSDLQNNSKDIGVAPTSYLMKKNLRKTSVPDKRLRLEDSPTVNIHEVPTLPEQRSGRHPIPPPRVKKHRSISPGQQPTSQAINMDHSKQLTTNITHQTPVKETNPCGCDDHDP